MAPHLWILLLTFLSANAASLLPDGHRWKSAPREWPCPLEDSIAPCTCEPDEHLNLNMDCSLVGDEYELRHVFTADFPFVYLQNFTIAQSFHDSNNIRKLDSGIFGDVNFQYVTITGTKIQVISENVFAESHSTLRSLDLSSNILSQFPFETLASFLSLQTLLLNDNKILTIPKLESESLEVLSISGNQELTLESDAFVSAQKLRLVSMGNIGLRELLPGLLTNLPDLTEVVLDNNQLVELTEGALHTMNNKLTKLSLAGNAISEVIHDSVIGLTDGASLLMANNEIKKLTESVWRSIFNQLIPTGTVDFEGNPLECGCDLKWVFDEADTFLPIISRLSSCGSGGLIHDLNPDYFDKFC